MKSESENIEEKLIPYLEGVLNPKERRQVEEAIHGDPELAREMSELRELVLELRHGFATGLKPPQEELSSDEIVEMSYHVGASDKLPGSSAQKARLFCSDSGLEEYSLLRALSEEMGKTTLDRENIPAMPAYLRQEFAALAGQSSGKKVLPFLKPALSSPLSSIPVWRKASGWLDRIDPKPLMASAAALMMLSLGVHLYNRPATSPASSKSEVASAVAGPSLSPSALDRGALVGAPTSETEGVAVFTSDDRGLLKEQAEKLLARKVRYTVTKDRILVSEKDVVVAREILWEDAEGKAVAMAQEEPQAKRMARTVVTPGAAFESEPSGTEQSQAGSAELDVSPQYAPPPVEGSVTLYSSARRADAPLPTAPRNARPKGTQVPAAELAQGLGKAQPEGRAAPPPSASAPPPAPSQVVLPALPSTVMMPSRAEQADSIGSSSPAISEARRQRLRDLAVGDDPGSPPSASREEESSQASVAERAAPRTSAAGASAAAPIPAVVKVDDVDTRLGRLQTSQQKTAQKFGVELSFERQDDIIVVYVRPNRSLDKAQLDELRKVLRKELDLAETDTLIFR